MSLACVPALAAPVSVTVLDANGSPAADAVVSVEVSGSKPTAPPGTQAEMGQRGRAFTPTLLVVQTGTAVSFPNFDTVRHHIYSFSPAKPFEIKLYSGTPAAPVVFDKAGTAILGCNIHDRMTAFIHVVNTPHFAIANPAGVVKLDVPAGDHTLQVWHMQMGDKQAPQRQSIKVPVAGNTSVVRLGGPPKP
ncbi:MAG: methylamine utilization protein [Gammaproteobacteria bacterium]|nr:methylamine utilization protein [Gammaproteobacteria bacterium]